MTNTLYQNIQALGNRMASNLETMGVSASFGDGGLTLADKILEIQHFSDGVLLCANKNIAQKNDTIKFSILVMEDGKFKSNASVSLFGEFLNQTYSSDTVINQDIGDEWTIDVGDANVWICEDGSTIAGGNGIISIDNQSLVIYKNGSQEVVRTTSTSVYSYKNGVLYYDNSSINISSYNVDVTNLYKTSSYGGTIKVTYPINLTTNSNGVATYDYTCIGSGLKEFYASYGMILSEIYSIMDYIYYNPCTSDTGNWYLNQHTEVEYTDEGSHFYSLGTGTNFFDLLINNNRTPFDGSQDFILEFDLKTANQIGIYLRDASLSSKILAQPPSVNTWNHYKWIYDANLKTITYSWNNNQGNTVDVSDKNLTNIGLNITDWQGDIDIWIKNFKVYPI